MEEYFKGVSQQERYQNELMYHARKQTELLEQIAQLLQSQKGDGNHEFHATSGVPERDISEGQQGQRGSDGNSNRRGRKPKDLHHRS